MKSKISITLNEKILRDVDSIIDNIFIRNRSQAIEYLIKKSFKQTKTAVILAGESEKQEGKIKERYALKINHSTIIERALKKLRDSGFNTIYIIAPHEDLTRIFRIIGNGSDYNIKIEFIDEEFSQGSGSALKLLKGKIKTTFLIVQCDLIFDHIDLNEFWNNHIQGKMTATMLLSSSLSCITPTKIKFGRVTLHGNKIVSYIEKPSMKNLKSSLFSGGLVVAEPEIFSYPGKSLELNIYPELVRKGLLGGIVGSAEHLHVHTKEELIILRKKLKEMNL